MSEATMRATSGFMVIGSLELDVLYMPCGKVVVPAVEAGALYYPQSPTNYNKEIKNVLGDRFEFKKTYSDIAQRMVNYLELHEFVELTVRLALRGNGTAQRFCKVFH